MRYAGSLRRAAAYELRLNRVNYVLLKDTDWGAKDFSDDPASWEMTKLVDASGQPLSPESISTVLPVPRRNSHSNRVVGSTHRAVTSSNPRT
jgi:hypothetical protein